MKSPYEILGVATEATQEEIRKAYLLRSKVLHPDRFDKARQPAEWELANEMLRELNAAYASLRYNKNSPPEAERQRPQEPASASERQTPPKTAANGSKPAGKPISLPKAGVAYFERLPIRIQRNLRARISGANRVQYRVSLNQIGWAYLWSVLLCGWFGLLYAMANAHTWDADECWAIAGITSLFALLHGANLGCILRWHASPLRCWLLVTPLYVMKTDFAKVTFWPIWELTGLRGTPNYRNGNYMDTSVIMTFKTGTEHFNVSPDSIYQGLADTLRIFNEKVRVAAKQNDASYFREADDLYDLPTEAAECVRAARWPVTLGYLISALLYGAAFTSAYTFNLYVVNESSGSPVESVSTAPEPEWFTPDPVASGLHVPSAPVQPSVPRSKEIDFEPLIPRSNQRFTSPVQSPELQLPKSGVFARRPTANPPIAPFEIKSALGSHYFVKLVETRTGQAILTVFVRGGDSVEVSVPLGTYEIRYASGDKWYGEDHLFGPNTSCSKADQTFTFRQSGSQVNGYSITLYSVANGNLQTESIPRSSF